MKKFRLLLAVAIAGATIAEASAQSYRNTSSNPETQTVYLFSSQSEGRPSRRAQEYQTEVIAISNQATVDAATDDYRSTYRSGFQQVEQPLLILAQRDNRFSFGVGGYINLRASYELDGICDNIDFVPYDIPVPGTYASHAQVMMDASTSRLFLKGIANTRALGQVEIFIDGDFRGGEAFSYTPRLRSAYVSFLGFTLGRDVTTFCDLDAAPRTIDFQGPNAYNFNFATMVRYECNLADDHFSMGIAAEYPKYWGTYGSTFAAIPQRVPDIPFYMQYEWGYNRQSHIRFSGVIRNPYMHNLTTEENTSLTGWGVQASGAICGSDWMKVVFNGVYGSSISQYIQDFTGAGLDFTPNPENTASMQTTPMWGYQIAGDFMLSERTNLNAGYSTAAIDNKHGYYSAEEYARGEYIFGNILYSLTPRLCIGGEYLYGRRKNVNGMRNHANRFNFMAQYNF